MGVGRRSNVRGDVRSDRGGLVQHGVRRDRAEALQCTGHLSARGGRGHRRGAPGHVGGTRRSSSTMASAGRAGARGDDHAQSATSTASWPASPRAASATTVATLRRRSGPHRMLNQQDGLSLAEAHHQSVPAGPRAGDARRSQNNVAAMPARSGSKVREVGQAADRSTTRLLAARASPRCPGSSPDVTGEHVTILAPAKGVAACRSAVLQ